MESIKNFTILPLEIEVPSNIRDFNLGLPANYLLDWHEKLPIPDKSVNKNSNPNLSKIIEEYISNKNFIEKLL